MNSFATIGNESLRIIEAEGALDAGDFADTIKTAGRTFFHHHAFDHEWDDWRYVEDCGCSACVMWEVWVTGWNHPGQDINEEEWWMLTGGNDAAGN